MSEATLSHLKQRDPELLVRSITKVASLPSIFTRLNDAINEHNTTNKDFANIINEDTAIAARLLRITNSALYNFPSKVETITHAITIIGTNQLRDLVLASSVIAMFKDVSEDVISMESFWRHSIACGIAARAIASLRREANIERFFVAGLLHDIGRLVLFMELPEYMDVVLQQRDAEGDMLYKHEREVIGFDHAQLGGLLLKAWQLPARLIEGVALHHAPMRAVQFPVEAAVVHAADVLANAMQLGSSGEKFVPAINPKAWEIIDIPTDSIESIFERTAQQYTDAVKFILGDS